MNDSSLPTSGKVFFELDTQTGVMHLLASIRASEIDTAHKNELRDLVFLYTNGGKDQSVRFSLEQKIAAYKLVALPPKVAPVPPLPPQPIIGKYRVAPSFAVPTPVSNTPVIPTVSAPVFTAEPAWKAQPAPEVISTPTPEPVAQVVAQPAAAPFVAPVEAPAPAPEVSTPVVETPGSSVVEGQDYLLRIREIKALVNEKVGNPVNLVDINNEVGREYMGALLDAMKKLNSGSSAMSAMKRLEEAYVAVEAALKQHEQQGGVKVTIQTPQPQVTTPVLEEPQISEPAFPPLQAKVPTEPKPSTPDVTLASRTGRLQIQEVIGEKTEEVVRDTFEPISTPKLQLIPTPVIAQPESNWQADPEPVTRAVPIQTFPSLAQVQEKPHTLNDLPLASSLKTSSVVGDDLFTKEVDDGLEQLLMEWSIFKKSGLFGSGPKGREHPLFKKIATLHIPLLLAGRFEGATQEIKQSVTDYMNGWRYEQGLIYQQGETFEHYLRRVIRHILDLQKPK